MQNVNAAALSETTAEIIPFVRSSNQFLETKEVAALLKQNLGLNARKVTVSARNSTTYLTVTVRDASVDLAAVTAFCKSLDSWSMDQTDYVTGQSISVATTPLVDAAHAAPFMAEAVAIAQKISDGVAWVEASNGAHVSKPSWNMEVSRPGKYRTAYGATPADVLDGRRGSVECLALAIARA